MKLARVLCKPHSTLSSPEKNAVVLSLGFFFVFAGFNSAQFFATSKKDAKMGSFSLFVLYLTFTISSMLVSPITERVQAKYALFFSSLTYGFYVVSNIDTIFPSYVVMIAAFIEGIGAAVLWIVEQRLITNLGHEYEQLYGYEQNSQLGYINGIFFTGFQFNKCIGNLIAALIFQFHRSTDFMYSFMSVVVLLGCCIFLLLQFVHLHLYNYLE
ncbi:hypothetical protein RFI_14182 [Reticulomyxa filosa]|uniref:ADP,ATP carrier protein n=1 Tax=Reticulomyxa filosa TaxID=46433 RepID=X6NB69_RETFI|nr:hypothetical protein RFI_14182 [Reticulomyxa filosa]|eukprot:ETO23004.1 hypothetical protein RFI_14182 [Reticulomyxa filosa]